MLSAGGLHRRLSFFVFIVWHLLYVANPTDAGGACDGTYTACPSATAAAEALTGNNVQLPVSNAAFSGTCSPGTQGWLLVTSFGPCHYLGQSMPAGGCSALQAVVPRISGCGHTVMHICAGKPIITTVSRQQTYTPAPSCSPPLVFAVAFTSASLQLLNTLSIPHVATLYCNQVP